MKTIKTKKIKLGIIDRWNIERNAYRLPSTLAVRLAFDAFIDSIHISNEEAEKAGLKVEDGVPTVKKDIKIEYDTATVSGDILNAIDDYIGRLESGATAPGSTLGSLLTSVNESLGLLVNE